MQQIPEYPGACASGQQQIAAQGATVDLGDSAIISNLADWGPSAGTEIGRPTSKTSKLPNKADPIQMTDMADVAEDQSRSAFADPSVSKRPTSSTQTIALHHIIKPRKSSRTAIKSKFQDASDYGTNFQSSRSHQPTTVQMLR